jgi:hypothetical protein
VTFCSTVFSSVTFFSSVTVTALCGVREDNLVVLNALT